MIELLFQVRIYSTDPAPGTHTLTLAHVHGYACPQKYFHVHSHTETEMRFSFLDSWVKALTRACCRAPLHFR